MNTTDPIADMLTRIRNANSAKHKTVDVPNSKMKTAIAEILFKEGYIKSFELINNENQGIIRITLKYDEKGARVIDGIKRISKPGLRVYAGKEELPRVLNGLGTAIISTSKGLKTDKEARENVHILRNELTAIMIGIDTVIIDNPELTCRIPNGRNPIRIVVDSNLRIPYDSKILQTAKKFKTIIATTEKARKEKIHKLKDLGIIVIETKSKNEKVDLKDLMHKLGNQNIDSILLEGGSTLNYSALESGIVDKILVYIAPKIIGGMKSKTPVGGSGISHLKDAFKVRELSTSIIGKDILLQGYIEGDES